MIVGIVLILLSVVLAILAGVNAGRAEGHAVAVRDRTPDGRFTPEQRWEREFGRTSRRRAPILAALGATLAVVGLVVVFAAGCGPRPTVERYQDTYGTVERTTYPDGSVRVRYVP